VDGIFCEGDPENFVWPKVLPGDNGQVNSMTLDDMAKQGDYTYLAAQVHFEDWTNAFAGNERECGASPSSLLFSMIARDIAGGMTRDLTWIMTGGLSVYIARSHWAGEPL
jgi:hypothetical protein